jgi:uncharacterized membrane protein
MHDSFAATLSARERRLSARLEGFGDIVFGFAVSQCALQLPLVHGHVDLSHLAGILSYFGTFALLATLWLTYHRLMSGPFKPARFDLLLAFAYLAFVSLMPYAMYSLTHQSQKLEGPQAAVAEYALLFALLMALAAVLTLRNLRRGWWHFDAEERDFTWNALLRRCVLCVVMIVGFAVDLVVGPIASSLALSCIPFIIAAVRMRFSHAPGSAALRISPQAGNAA